MGLTRRFLGRCHRDPRFDRIMSRQDPDGLGARNPSRNCLNWLVSFYHSKSIANSTTYVPAMAEIAFSFTLAADFDEFPKLIGRALLTLLVACVLKFTIYMIHYDLPHGSF